jgi:hypothetical protein
MTIDTVSAEKLAEAVRLSTLLSERVLDALITKRSITSEEGVALAKVARLLQDQGVEWPPLLTQVIHELAHKEEGAASTVTEPSKALTDMLAGGFSRFFSRPRARTDEP